MRESNLYKCFFCSSLVLAIWGCSNVIYWELYMGYPACDICLWHRYLYITLFLLTILLSIKFSSFIRRVILLVVGAEVLVSLKAFSFFCSQEVCKIITKSDLANLILSLIILFVLLVIEFCLVKKNCKV